MFLCSNIWITTGCFLGGMLLGSLVLLLTVKKAKSNLKDPWEEIEDQEFDDRS